MENKFIYYRQGNNLNGINICRRFKDFCCLQDFFAINNFANSKFWDCSELVNTNQYWMMELVPLLFLLCWIKYFLCIWLCSPNKAVLFSNYQYWNQYSCQCSVFWYFYSFNIFCVKVAFFAISLDLMNF